MKHAFVNITPLFTAVKESFDTLESFTLNPSEDIN